MIESGSGRIVNISSIIGEIGNVGQANYAASKSAVRSDQTLAREAAFQLGRAGKLEDDGIGVTVNTVAPGFIATEMLEHVPAKVLDGSGRKSRWDDSVGPTKSLARPFPGRGSVRVHHRCDFERQRRDGHVMHARTPSSDDRGGRDG